MTGQNLEIIIQIVLWYENSFYIDWTIDIKISSFETMYVKISSFETMYIQISSFGTMYIK